MSLTTDQKKRLRTRAHTLNPIVMVGGNGLTENVQLEVDRALEDHELIKVPVSHDVCLLMERPEF